MDMMGIITINQLGESSLVGWKLIERNVRPVGELFLVFLVVQPPAKLQ